MKDNPELFEHQEGTSAEEILSIKHMVCSICIRVIQEKLASLGLPVQEVQLGRVRFARPLEPEELQAVAQSLGEEGFEVISRNTSKVVDQIKELIGETLYPYGSPKGLKYSEYLAKSIGRDYSFLSQTFSALENTTIEQYIIRLKVERAKELLRTTRLALNQIANLLAYSSVGHFSLQFKKVTGITPSGYRHVQKNGTDTYRKEGL